MIWNVKHPLTQSRNHDRVTSPLDDINTVAADCASVHSDFSAYLDGAMSGVAMSAMSRHLEQCATCSAEFAVWRSMHHSLGELGQARPPARLQARLRAALSDERERGAHLPLVRRALLLWDRSLASKAVWLSRGFAAALVMVGGLSWLFAGPIAVQANDDAMAHLVAPRYLYSQVPPQPLNTHHDVPIVVEAMVDSAGRVYDYSILAGPQDPETRIRVEDNLLSSVFRPATAFGVPVRGHVVLTYSGVSVRG